MGNEVTVQIEATLRVTCERTIDAAEFERLDALSRRRGGGKKFYDEVDDLLSRGDYEIELEDVTAFDRVESDGSEVA